MPKGCHRWRMLIKGKLGNDPTAEMWIRKSNIALAELENFYSKTREFLMKKN